MNSWKIYSLLATALLALTSLALVAGDQASFPDAVQVEELISSLKVDGDNELDIDSSIRSKRQAPPTTKAPPAEDLNLAEDVSEDYPVIFNIVLFLAISLILALIAISVALATMDPGRDSLIYRVTSAQRFKKEN